MGGNRPLSPTSPRIAMARCGGPVAYTATAIVLSLSLCAAPAAGNVITIAITPDVEIHDASMVVKLTVRNTGDVSALDVTPVLRFRSHEARGKGTERLLPQTELIEELILPVEDLGPGRWPCQAIVDYVDERQHPFQALLVGTVPIGDPPPELAGVGVTTIAPIATLSPSKLTIDVENESDSDRTAVLRVLVPAGVEVTSAPREVVLAAGERKSLAAMIVNRILLPDSRVPVFVAVEYDDGAVHQTIVARAEVAIVSPASFVDRHQLAFVVAGFVLVVVWSGLLVTRLLGRRRGRGEF